MNETLSRLGRRLLLRNTNGHVNLELLVFIWGEGTVSELFEFTV